MLLLGDAWLKPGVTGITIPFTLEYRPLWTGMGILAGYLALLLGPTFYWRRKIGAKRWRQIHRATVVVFVLAVAHSLGSGTDGAGTWFRLMVLGSAALVLALVVAPLRPPGAATKAEEGGAGSAGSEAHSNSGSSSRLAPGGGNQRARLAVIAVLAEVDALPSPERWAAGAQRQHQ